MNYILKRFIRDGYRMVNHHAAVDPSTRKRKITPELAAYLTSKETLQKWAGMPLKRRVGQLVLE